MGRINQLTSVAVLGLVWFSRLLAILVAVGGVVYFADYFFEPETSGEVRVVSVTTRGKAFLSHQVATVWFIRKEECERLGSTYTNSNPGVTTCGIEIRVSDRFADRIKEDDKLRLKLSPLFGHGLEAVEVNDDIEYHRKKSLLDLVYIFLFACPSLIVCRNLSGMSLAQKTRRAISSIALSLFMIVWIVLNFIT